MGCKRIGWRFPLAMLAVGSLVIGTMAYGERGDRGSSKDKSTGVAARVDATPTAVPTPRTDGPKRLAAAEVGILEGVERITTSATGSAAAGVEGATTTAYSALWGPYVAGPWNVDDPTTCAPGLLWHYGDDLGLFGIKGDGTDELASYDVCWYTGCSIFAHFGARSCAAGSGSSCEGICYNSGASCKGGDRDGLFCCPGPSGQYDVDGGCDLGTGLCIGGRRAGEECCPGGGSCDNPADPPYNITTVLWDGPPNPDDGSCGAGNMIPGTMCVFTTSLNPSVCATCTVDKALIPHAELWITMGADIDDHWLAIGGVPSIGTSAWYADFYNDADADGCYDSFMCFAGTAPFGVDDWMAVEDVAFNAQIAVKLVPVDPPADSKHAAASTYAIGAKGAKEDVAFLYKGGEPVWFEIVATDFDPKQSGIQIGGMQTRIDGSGYTSGVQGTVTPWVVACASNAECVDQLGSMSGASPRCAPVGYPANVCEYALINNTKSDYILQGGFTAIDPSSANVGYLGATTAPVAKFLPKDQQYYYGSIVFFVSANAKGQFTIDLLPFPETQLTDAAGQFFPLVGLVPGHVEVLTGQCCDLDLIGTPDECIADDLTQNECFAAGGETFDPNKTCDDPCACTTNADCADGDTCTVDVCEADGSCSNNKVAIGADECCDDTAGDDVLGTGPIVSKDDGDECTADTCSAGGNRGTPVNTPTPGAPCGDRKDCEVANEVCLDTDGDGDGFIDCVGKQVAGQSCDPLNGNADCLALYAGDEVPAPEPECSAATNTCICQLPQLVFEIDPSDKPNPNCFAQGEKLEVDVNFTAAPLPVNGAQFMVLYDPSCLVFNSISPCGDPYVFEIEEIVDRATGMIFYAVGVDPFGGQGVSGDGCLATISFTKIAHPDCSNCILTFGGTPPDNKPLSTVLVDDTGQTIKQLTVKPSKEIHVNDRLTLNVPPNMGPINADCDVATAVVTWDAPTASSSCFRPGCDPSKEKCYDVNLDCSGIHENGDDMTGLAMTGGVHHQGVTYYECTVTSKMCGDSVTKSWTVTVTDDQSLDIELQLSPIMAGPVERCINFELWSDCVQPPYTFQQDVEFGGKGDFIGKLTDKKKIPKGQYVCITARDQQHSLRACDLLECIGGQWYASLTGDPFFGGKWLIQGNLDGWKKGTGNASVDHIDILDFGQFVAQFGEQPDPNTDCETKHDGPHADINGDGVVDSLDFSFIALNFLADSNDCCCPDSEPSASVARTEVSVVELRQMGLDHMTVADLNGDGLVNMDDMSAFMAGQVPSKKTLTHDRSGLGGSR